MRIVVKALVDRVTAVKLLFSLIVLHVCLVSVWVNEWTLYIYSNSYILSFTVGVCTQHEVVYGAICWIPGWYMR